MQIKQPPLHYPTYCVEMARRMPCQHGNPRPRKRGLKTNGSPFYRYQCPECGAALQPTQLKFAVVREFEAQGGVVEDWDQEALAAFYATRRGHDEDIRRKYGWTQEDWMTRYELYLASEEWRLLRKKVLERDRQTCQACLVATATQVHHLTYVRAGNEDLADLLSLCRPCHRGIHGAGALTSPT